MIVLSFVATATQLGLFRNRCETDLTFIGVFKLLLLLENGLYGLLADRTKVGAFHERLSLHHARSGQVAKEDDPAGQGKDPEDIARDQT